MTEMLMALSDGDLKYFTDHELEVLMYHNITVPTKLTILMEMRKRADAPLTEEALDSCEEEEEG